jgi:hypothetical protein
VPLLVLSQLLECNGGKIEDLLDWVPNRGSLPALDTSWAELNNLSRLVPELKARGLNYYYQTQGSIGTRKLENSVYRSGPPRCTF